MARIEDLEDVGYRVKYDDAGKVVAIVGSRGEPSPFVLATTNLTGVIEISTGDAFYSPDSGYSAIVAIGDSIVMANNVYAVVTSITGNGTIATATSPTAHNLSPGGDVFVGGCVETQFNGLFKVLSVTSQYIFTYDVGVVLPVAATGPQKFLVFPSQRNAVGAVVSANALLESPFEKIYNLGVGGQRLDQILARFDSDVSKVPTGFSAILIEGGTNDVLQGNGSLATDSVYNGYLDQIITKAKNTGKPVILCTILPINTSGGATAAHKKQVLRLNAYRRNRASVDKQIRLFDWFAATVDPSNVNSEYRTGWTFDGIHPSDVAGLPAGKSLATVLSGIVTQTRNARLASSVLDAYSQAGDSQRGPNPMLTGSSGSVGAGCTGTAPANTTCLRINGSVITAVSSVEARTESVDGDSIGNNWVLDCSNVGGVAGETINGYVTIPSGNFVSGELVRLSAHIQGSNLSGFRGCNLIFSFVANGINYSISASQAQYPAGYGESFSMVFSTDPIYIPGTPASIYIFFRPIFEAGGSGKLKMGRPTVIAR